MTSTAALDLSQFGALLRDELEEVLRLVKPQHFLPVHGEYSFLCAHAELARSTGILNTNVIRNGQMLGCAPLRNGKSLGGLQLLGNTSLKLLYNDGNNVRTLLGRRLLHTRAPLQALQAVAAEALASRAPILISASNVAQPVTAPITDLPCPD